MLSSLFNHFPRISQLLRDLEHEEKSTIVNITEEDVKVGDKTYTLRTQYTIQARLGLDELKDKRP